MGTQEILDNCNCSNTDKEWYYHSPECPVFVISERLNRLEEWEDEMELDG